MKKTYQNPTIDVTMISNEDILTASKLSVAELPGVGDSIVW